MPNFLQLPHQFFVDMETASGIDNQQVIAFFFALSSAALATLTGSVSRAG